MDGDWAGKIVGAVIAIVIAVALVPTIFTTINGTAVYTNSTNGTAVTWSTLTGGAGAQSIAQLILLVFVAGVVIAIIKYFIS